MTQDEDAPAASGGDASWPVPTPEPGAPGSGPGRVVFLLDAASGLEGGLLRDWIEAHRPESLDPGRIDRLELPSSRRRRRRARLDPGLEAALAAGDDPWLAPLRIAWQAPERDGSRSILLRDLFPFGDPRDPGRLRQRWILARDRERARVVVAEPARASELRARWAAAGGTDSGATTGLAEFVARQAQLALERAERKLRGARYKVPRLVEEEVLGRPAFRGELQRLARERGRPLARALRSATSDLREIAATHSPYVIDLVAHLIRLLYTQGYGESLQYDREQLQGLYRLAQRHPVVFLPTHRSNLDHLVLQYALHENGLPPNHTAGGINMNFFPVGPLVRRSGVFFIRRSFKDDPIYKLVLRSYIDYLIEKRFSLEWYIEGGRSRSGKLLPPRFGLLAYVVDAFRRGKSDDVFLVPVSIAYDQIQEVGTYADEQRGARKQKESFGWFVGVVRSLRRRYGDIHIRFGEPLSLARHLGPPEPERDADPDERSVDLQKLAFEVCVRINRVTPITPTSLATLALLGVGDRALTVEETHLALEDILEYVRERKLPSTHELSFLGGAEGVRHTLDALADNGIVSRSDVGPESVYSIGPEQQLVAAYYRNSVVHHFANAAICELALLRAGSEADEDATELFWDEAMALRDLLKFEFFFAEKEAFRGELREEISFQDGDWEALLGRGPEGAQQLVQDFRPYSSHRVLRPFLEAYLVAAEVLRAWPPDREVDRSELVKQGLALGRQFHLRHRIQSGASVSQVLLESALRLAENRGLLEVRGAEGVAGREAFHAEIRASVRRAEVVDALAASRRAGWLA